MNIIKCVAPLMTAGILIAVLPSFDDTPVEAPVGVGVGEAADADDADAADDADDADAADAADDADDADGPDGAMGGMGVLKPRLVTQTHSRRPSPRHVSSNSVKRTNDITLKTSVTITYRTTATPTRWRRSTLFYISTALNTCFEGHIANRIIPLLPSLTAALPQLMGTPETICLPRT